MARIVGLPESSQSAMVSVKPIEMPSAFSGLWSQGFDGGSLGKFVLKVPRGVKARIRRA